MGTSLSRALLSFSGTSRELICCFGLFLGAIYRRFDTLTVRLARLTVNAFLENVDLVVRTLENFGEDAERPPPSASQSVRASLVLGYIRFRDF